MSASEEKALLAQASHRANEALMTAKQAAGMTTDLGVTINIAIKSVQEAIKTSLKALSETREAHNQLKGAIYGTNNPDAGAADSYFFRAGAELEDAARMLHALEEMTRGDARENQAANEVVVGAMTDIRAAIEAMSRYATVL